MLKKTKLWQQHSEVEKVNPRSARVLVTEWRLFGILIFRSIED